MNIWALYAGVALLAFHLVVGRAINTEGASITRAGVYICHVFAVAPVVLLWNATRRADGVFVCVLSIALAHVWDAYARGNRLRAISILMLTSFATLTLLPFALVMLS